MIVRKIMKLFKNLFQGNKLNANEIAIETENNKYKNLNNVINEINSKGLKKLWENTATSKASFPAQDITLSSDDYDYLIWIYSDNCYNDTDWGIQMSQMCLKGDGVKLTGVGDEHTPGTAQYYVAIFFRKVIRNSDTSYTVNTCYYKLGADNTQYSTNERLIPRAVYGGKF